MYMLAHATLTTIADSRAHSYNLAGRAMTRMATLRARRTRSTGYRHGRGCDVASKAPQQDTQPHHGFEEACVGGLQRHTIRDDEEGSGAGGEAAGQRPWPSVQLGGAAPTCQGSVLQASICRYAHSYTCWFVHMLSDIRRNVHVSIHYAVIDTYWGDRVGDQGEGQWEEDWWDVVSEDRDKGPHQSSISTWSIDRHQCSETTGSVHWVLEWSWQMASIRVVKEEVSPDAFDLAPRASKASQMQGLREAALVGLVSTSACAFLTESQWLFGCLNFHNLNMNKYDFHSLRLRWVHISELDFDLAIVDPSPPSWIPCRVHREASLCS